MPAFTQTLVFISATFCIWIPLAHAKIADPESIVHEQIRYRSHMNQVFAEKEGCRTWKEEAEGKKLDCRLWETTLPFSTKPWITIPFMETDVQLCIITELSLETNRLKAKNCRGKSYYLDLKTGQIQ